MSSGIEVFFFAERDTHTSRNENFDGQPISKTARERDFARNNTNKQEEEQVCPMPPREAGK